MADSDKVVEVTDANFQDVIGGDEGVTMVDFWAVWCGPCRMVAPIVSQLADEYADQGVTVGKMDVDSNPSTPAQFGVRSIPSILFFKGGEHVDTVIGAVPRQQLESVLQKHL